MARVPECYRAAESWDRGSTEWPNVMVVKQKRLFYTNLNQNKAIIYWKIWKEQSTLKVSLILLDVQSLFCLIVYFLYVLNQVQPKKIFWMWISVFPTVDGGKLATVCWKRQEKWHRR